MTRTFTTMAEADAVPCDRRDSHEWYSDRLRGEGAAAVCRRCGVRVRTAPMKVDPDVLAAECADCREPYGSPSFPDLVIADWAWKKIAPTSDGNGLLCPGCLLARLTNAGIECSGKFTSGPLASAPAVVPEDEAMVDIVSRLLQALEMRQESYEAEARLILELVNREMAARSDSLVRREG